MKTPVMVSSSGKVTERILIISFFKAVTWSASLSLLLDRSLSSPRRGGSVCQGLLLKEQELCDGRGGFLVRLRFSQGKLGEVRDEQGIDDGNPVPLCGKIGKEGDMVAGRRFHTEKQRAVSLWQLHNEFLKSLSVHRADNGEHFRAVIPDAARIELLFRHIDPDKERHLRTSSHVAEKQGLPLRQSSSVTRAHKAQSTYHGSKRQGTDCNKGSATREEVSPPAFLGANLTASHYLLIQELRVGGRSLWVQNGETGEAFTSAESTCFWCSGCLMIFEECFTYSLIEARGPSFPSASRRYSYQWQLRRFGPEG